MSHQRRAPRLDPHERIAGHLDRGRGSFSRIDPLAARPLPAFPRMLGVLAWAALVLETLRRAWQRSRLKTPEMGGRGGNRTRE